MKKRWIVSCLALAGISVLPGMSLAEGGAREVPSVENVVLPEYSPQSINKKQLLMNQFNWMQESSGSGSQSDLDQFHFTTYLGQDREIRMQVNEKPEQQPLKGDVLGREIRVNVETYGGADGSFRKTPQGGLAISAVARPDRNTWGSVATGFRAYNASGKKLLFDFSGDVKEFQLNFRDQDFTSTTSTQYHIAFMSKVELQSALETKLKWASDQEEKLTLENQLKNLKAGKPIQISEGVKIHYTGNMAGKVEIDMDTVFVDTEKLTQIALEVVSINYGAPRNPSGSKAVLTNMRFVDKEKG